VRDRPNSSSLQVCDQVFDLDGVMEFGFNVLDNVSPFSVLTRFDLDDQYLK